MDRLSGAIEDLNDAIFKVSKKHNLNPNEIVVGLGSLTANTIAGESSDYTKIEEGTRLALELFLEGINIYKKFLQKENISKN